MINNLCETPWWSLWWHLIWDLFICWGARHDITWGHFMAMSGKYHIISGWMFQRFCSTIQLCIDQWIEGQSYMHSCILICGCIHLYMYIYIFWLISRFSPNHTFLHQSFQGKNGFFFSVTTSYLGFDGSCCLFRSRRGLLIFIDEAEAFLCCRSRQSNAYVRAALFEPKIWSNCLYCWT